jgi:hypothetical protein
MPLEIGQVLTRQEISDRLGGSPQAYLPFVDGKVVCGCFVPGPSMNPDAPEEILFGNDGESPDINKAADMVFSQGQLGEAIPVFVKASSGNWVYKGKYLCIGITRDPRVVARKMQENPQRGHFHGILRFESVQ